MDRMKGKVAFLTGAGAGIAKATAKAFAAQGAEPLVTTPAQFGAIIAADVSLWSRIVRETGATVD